MSHRARLDVPAPVLRAVTGWIARHRRRAGARPWQRAATVHAQVVLVLRWLRHRADLHTLAWDARISDATAYRYLHEGLDVIAAHAPDLHQVIDQAHAAGMAFLCLDGTLRRGPLHGHPAGDEVLVHLAAVLTEQVRADDAVLSRMGGEELAVLLPGCSAEVAERRPEALLEAVRSTPVTLTDGTPLALSISLGVADLPQHANGLERLYETAGAALYDAKRAGADASPWPRPERLVQSPVAFDAGGRIGTVVSATLPGLTVPRTAPPWATASWSDRPG